MIRTIAAVLCLALAATAAAAPKIFCEKPIHTFGDKGQETKFDVDFIVENRGNSDLVISEVRLTCGCTKHKLERQTIPAGQKAKLVISADTAKKGAGKQDWKIRIHSNDPESPMYVLSLKGRIVPAFVGPEELNLGEVHAGKGKTISIELKRQAQSKADITSITSTDRSVAGRVTKRATEQDNTAVVEVQVTPEAKPGVIDQRLSIHTSDPRQRRLTVHLTGKIIAEVDVSVERVFFGVISRTAKPARDVTIAQGFSSDGKDLEILGTKFDGTHVGVSVKTIEKGRKYVLSFAVKPDTPPGTLIDKLTVTTNKDAFKTIEIPVYGLIRE